MFIVPIKYHSIEFSLFKNLHGSLVPNLVISGTKHHKIVVGTKHKYDKKTYLTLKKNI